MANKTTTYINLYDIHDIEITTNSLNLECTIKDEIFNIDRKIKIEIPKALINGKLVLEKVTNDIPLDSRITTTMDTETTKVNLEITGLSASTEENQIIVAKITEITE